MLIYKHLFTQDIHNRYKKATSNILETNPASCFQVYLQCNDFLTELISEDLHTAALRGKSQQISEKTLLPLVISFLQSLRDQTGPCCFGPAELQLWLVLRCIEEDGTEGGEGLPGPGGGQPAPGPHDADTVSFPQRQDHAEGHGPPAATVSSRGGPVLAGPCRALQPLHPAVRHGQNGLHPVPPLRRQQTWDQVSAVQRGGEDPCRVGRVGEINAWVTCLLMFVVTVRPVFQHEWG